MAEGASVDQSLLSLTKAVPADHLSDPLDLRMSALVRLILRF